MIGFPIKRYNDKLFYIHFDDFVYFVPSIMNNDIKL